MKYLENNVFFNQFQCFYKLLDYSVFLYIFCHLLVHQSPVVSDLLQPHYVTCLVPLAVVVFLVNQSELLWQILTEILEYTAVVAVEEPDSLFGYCSGLQEVTKNLDDGFYIHLVLLIDFFDSMGEFLRHDDLCFAEIEKKSVIIINIYIVVLKIY